MEDFRSRLSALLDEMLARGDEPVFLVVDLLGAEQIKKTQGNESMDRFREAAIGAVTTAGRGCDVFSYGEERFVAVLKGMDRLASFAMAEKLRRGLPLLAQSFDCVIEPGFDFIEYDQQAGVGGLIVQLTRREQRDVA